MKKILLITPALLALMSATFTSCSSDDKDEPAAPSVTITLANPTVSEITETTVTLSSKVSSMEGVASLGFCYSTSANPTITDGKVFANANGTTFSATITALTAETTYYVRSFASANNQVVYSSQETFTTAKGEVVSPTPTEILTYRGPSYPDDYRTFAGWDQRSQWNLANVHDPTVMLADDGYYYMYQTDASFGNAHTSGGHFHGRRSKDLVNWEYLGGTMASKPKWIMEKTNEYRAKLGLPEITESYEYGYWAPTARNLGNGVYRMYYSIVNDGCLIEAGAWPERSFIGMMETRDPASNQWEDKGFVLCAASDRGTDWFRPANKQWEAYNRWNAIDPSFIITPEGEHWLIYGSWHSGFAAVQLDPQTGKTLQELPDPWGTKEDIAPYGKLVNTRDMKSRWQGSEGPEVVYHQGYYYMFMAYDALDVPYNTRVVRSTKIDGPYTDMYGTNVSDFGGDAFPIVTHPYKFNNSPGWVGISHCAIFDDGKGNWFYSSQARFPVDYDNWAPNAIMLGHVRAIRWDKSGWPLVMPERYGAVPQLPISEDELYGSWENIPMTYEYGKQITGTNMTLGTDHKVSGGDWAGKSWSYDKDNEVLTIDGQELYLMRECNWESPTRPATIVFAGYGIRKTYWGKKNN